MSFSKTHNEDEIETRTSIAWKKFWSLKEILKGDYSINLKKTVLDTCILPSLLYGCQTWIFTTTAKQMITKTQRAMERSILNIRKNTKNPEQSNQTNSKGNRRPHTSSKIEMAVGRSHIEIQRQQVDNKCYNVERAHRQKKVRETE
nr:uncharacterized protein LOC113398718 [Vanessa tameamea]